MVNPFIFRMYDIRGIVGLDLTGEVFQLIGKAFGSYIQEKKGKVVVVGRDVRPSSKEFQIAMIEGIISTGCNVIDLGEVSTPIMNFSIAHLSTDGGCMITASHNPPHFNGMKLRTGKHPLISDELQQLRIIIEKNQFRVGTGKIKKAQVVDDYIECIEKKINLKKKLKIVIDAGNASVGPIAPKLFKKLGCEVIELYCEPDGTFPNHHPDPMHIENLSDLINQVCEQNADIGLAYDGDGDRLGIIDDKGSLVDPNEYVAIIANEILKEKSRTIVYEVKVSMMLIDEVGKQGGTFVMSKTGYPFITKTMREYNAAIGGEASGHFYFDDPDIHFDDAIYASCRLLEILSEGNKRLSFLRSYLPKYFSTPEIRVSCPDDRKFKVVEGLKEDFKREYEIIDIDGARVLFGDGWGLVRPSNTEAGLTLKFEAKTEERLRQIKKIFKKKLAEYPYIEGLEFLE